MNEKGLFAALFDLSFTEFVTTRIIKFLFLVGVLFAALGTLALIVAGFTAGFFKGLFALIVSPLVFLLYSILARMWCELIIVVFRIAENTGRMVEQRRE